MLLIRKMEMEDLDQVYALEVDSYKSPWTKEMFLSEIQTNKYAYLFVAIYNEVIIGYYGFWAIDDHGMITKVTISKPLRGKGIGKILLTDALKRMKILNCESISLEVRVSNQVAINLYEKDGFKKVATRKKYYSDGEDAYTMIYRYDKGEVKDEETYIRD